jgi:hypothetical protein
MLPKRDSEEMTNTSEGSPKKQKSHNDDVVVLVSGDSLAVKFKKEKKEKDETEKVADVGDAPTIVKVKRVKKEKVVETSDTGEIPSEEPVKVKKPKKEKTVETPSDENDKEEPQKKVKKPKKEKTVDSGEIPSEEKVKVKRSKKEKADTEGEEETKPVVKSGKKLTRAQARMQEASTKILAAYYEAEKEKFFNCVEGEAIASYEDFMQILQPDTLYDFITLSANGNEVEIAVESKRIWDKVLLNMSA